MALAITLTACVTNRSTERLSLDLTSSDGYPLADVEITLKEVTTGAVRSAVTNQEGSVALGALPAGEYELSLPGLPIDQSHLSPRRIVVKGGVEKVIVRAYLGTDCPVFVSGSS